MQLAPRYDAVPIIDIAGPADAVRHPFLRQRRRLLTVLEGLDDDQWRSPSRCEGWTVQDVATHLVTVDQFWAASIAAGVAGEPTRILDGFDPQATPAALVTSSGEAAPEATMHALRQATAGLCSTVEGLDAEGWCATAEAPPGHVSVGALLHHALWDAWVHERDVAVPLGVTPTVEDDEVIACLRYVAGLGPALAIVTGHGGRGALGLDVNDPDATVLVEVDGSVRVTDGSAPPDVPVLRGDAVELLEQLSQRAPLQGEVPAAHAWMVAGLGYAFDA